MYNRIDRVFSYVLIGFACAGGVVLIYVMITVGFEVVMRYFLNRPTNWVVDFTEYGLIFLAFLGAAWVLAGERHTKIEILLERLPVNVQRRLNTGMSVVGAFFCGIFFWYCLQITVEAIELGKLFFKSIVFPQWPIWTVMTMGSLLLTLQFLRRTWYYVRDRTGV